MDARVCQTMLNVSIMKSLAVGRDGARCCSCLPVRSGAAIGYPIARRDHGRSDSYREILPCSPSCFPRRTVVEGALACMLPVTAWGMPAHAAQNALTVDQSGRGTHATISEALATADIDTVIRIAPGTYRERLRVDLPVSIRAQQVSTCGRSRAMLSHISCRWP